MYKSIDNKYNECEETWKQSNTKHKIGSTNEDRRKQR